MIGANNSNNKNSIPTIRVITCPACNKNRLHKYANEDGTVTQASQETVEVRDGQRFLEACGPCVERYKKQDQQFVRDNLKKLSKAFKSDNIPEDGTDHKDFSLN